MPSSPYIGRIKVQGMKVTSIVFTELGNEQSVLEGYSVWVDDVGYDRRPLIEDGTVECEAANYEAIGGHASILKSFGLETVDPTTNALALRLEQAPLGCLRMFTMKAPAEKIPSIATRLRMAADFAERLSHIHGKSIIWVDISVRNTLLFDNCQIEISGFGGAGNPEADDDRMEAYEARYNLPVRFIHGEIPLMAREISALGTALCEITEWRVPYGTSDDEEDELIPRMRRGELPDMSADNQAKDIIMRCRTEYTSVSES